MNWRRAASEILRALRGRRSQAAFSRRLGYRSNVACDWEAGRRFPTASETLRACGRTGVDVDAAFAAFQPACAHALRKGTRLQLDSWLSSLRGSTTLTSLAARSGYSRYAIARWLRGQAQPRLPDFLALVEAISARTSDLVEGLVRIEAVPELYAVHVRRAAAKRIAFDVPSSEAVLRVMETSGYRAATAHSPGYIAARLELTLDQEREILRALEAAAIVRRKHDRYVDLQPLTVDTTAPAEDLDRLKAHWTAVAGRRLRAPRASDWFGYNVVSTSTADLERVREVLRRAYREIRAIAAASEPVESVALLNLQLVTWNDR